MSAVRVPGEPRRFSLAGFQGMAIPEVEGAVQTRLLPDPMARALEGEVLRKSTTRRTARVRWEGVGSVLLKVHRARSWKERLLSLVRRSRARAEWDAVRYLQGVGAPVPDGLAMGERTQLGMTETSFFAARFLEGLRPVHDVLPEQADGPRAVLHERLARLIRSLHERGFDHRDLHSGNVLAGPGPGAHCRLVVTDLHRCAWGGILSRRERVRGVTQWVHAVRDEIHGAALRTWLETYLGGDPAEDLDAWVADVQRGVVAFEHRRLKSRGKRCFKESTVYTRDVGGGWGARRRDLEPAQLEAALAAHDQALQADDERVVKRGRRGVVTAHGDLVVKERLAPDASTKLRDALWPKRHASGYRNAHKLLVHEVGTAKPLAHLRRGGRSWTLYEDLSALPRLDHLAREVFTDGTPEAQRDLLEASARWVGQLHASGIYHGDLKGVNVLVGGEEGARRFHLIDTDHARFFDRSVDRRRRIKNLAQLAASIPACVTPDHRAQWYAWYAEALPGGAGSAAETAAVCREVDAQLAQKIVVVDEPIE